MVKLLFLGAFCFFAVFGFLQLMRVLCGAKRTCSACHIVIPLKDCQQSVEGILAGAAIKHGEARIIAVDMNSRDETFEIARRTAEIHRNINLLSCDEYIEFLKSY